MGEQDRLEAEKPSSEGAGAITALVDAMRPMDQATAALFHEASHAMRTPLASIVGFAEVLTEGGAGVLNADQERMLGIIARSASELLYLVDAFDPGVPEARAARADAEPDRRRGRPGDRGFRG